MKSIFFLSLAAFGLSLSTQAAQTITNDYFVVNISGHDALNKGANKDDIERIALDSINYWASILDDSIHRPKTDQQKVNFNLDFNYTGGALAQAVVNASFIMGGMENESTGMSYNWATHAEGKLRDYTFPDSVYGSDFTVTASQSERFFFGETGGPDSDEYDFHTVLLHEIGHGMGFISKAFNQSGATTSDRTAYDTLYLQNIGGDPKNLTLGEDIYLGDPSEGILLHNPDSWVPSQSIIHIDKSTDALMNYGIAYGEVKRGLSDAELSLLTQMGWTLNLVPEPSSTFLMLLTMPFLLSYRRRKRV